MTEKKLQEFWKSLTEGEIKILLHQYFSEMSKKSRQAKIEERGAEGYRLLMKRVAKSKKPRKNKK